MGKRPTVDVDEEYLKEIMAGGISPLKREKQKQESSKPENEEAPEKEEKEMPHENKEQIKPQRKKREVQDYESIFLERKAGTARQQTYIGAELYGTITGFLNVIAGHGFSVTAYVNNILAHHLEIYKDDINELYDKKIKKPL